jgi:hypothetical protein
MSEDIVSFTSGGKEYMFVKPPKVVGWWQITPDVDGGWSTKFAVYKKPEEHHIKNTEDMFGWKWIEATDD